MSLSYFETLSNPVKVQPYPEMAQGTWGKTDQKFSKGKKKLQGISLPLGNAVMHLQSADPIGNMLSGKYQMQSLGWYRNASTEIIPSGHILSIFHHYLI